MWWDHYCCNLQMSVSLAPWKAWNWPSVPVSSCAWSKGALQYKQCCQENSTPRSNPEHEGICLSKMCLRPSERWWQQMVRKRKHPKCCGACNKDKRMQKVLRKCEDVRRYCRWTAIKYSSIYSIQYLTGTYCMHNYRATVTVAGFHKSTVPSLINSFGWFPRTSTIFGTTRNRSTEIRTFQINQIQTSTDWVTWKWANWKLDWWKMTSNATHISFMTQAMNNWKNKHVDWRITLNV